MEDDKWHIGKDGKPHRCNAQEGNCPLGGSSGTENHYSSLADATRAAERMASTNQTAGRLSKSTPTVAPVEVDNDSPDVPSFEECSETIENIFDDYGLNAGNAEIIDENAFTIEGPNNTTLTVYHSGDYTREGLLQDISYRIEEFSVDDEFSNFYNVTPVSDTYSAERIYDYLQYDEEALQDAFSGLLNEYGDDWDDENNTSDKIDELYDVLWKYDLNNYGTYIEDDSEGNLDVMIVGPNNIGHVHAYIDKDMSRDEAINILRLSLDEHDPDEEFNEICNYNGYLDTTPADIMRFMKDDYESLNETRHEINQELFELRKLRNKNE